MVYMYHSFLIHSSADGHLGCFHVLAMINSAVMNTGVYVSLSDLVSSLCMPRSGIAGSYGSFFHFYHLELLSFPSSFPPFPSPLFLPSFFSFFSLLLLMSLFIPLPHLPLFPPVSASVTYKNEKALVDLTGEPVQFFLFLSNLAFTRKGWFLKTSRMHLRRHSSHCLGLSFLCSQVAFLLCPLQ